jgi:hypothetical protein
MRALLLAALLTASALGTAPAAVAQAAALERDPAPAVNGLDRSSAAGRAFAEGWDAYTRLDLAEAVDRWREAADLGEAPALRAWLGEALRRLGQQVQEEALVREGGGEARRALAADGCSAHAHLVLADAYNGQFFEWSAASADSTALHLQRAAACDPDDGNVWMAVWTEVVRLGDAAAEAEALDRLHAVGFWTPPVLAFAQWTLRNVPADAILLTNGDADTVPLRLVQEVEGLRPDVAVVNVPLLDLPEVARRTAAAHGLPLPDSVEASVPRYDPRGSTTTPDGRVYSLRDAVVDAWLAAHADGALGRPLVAAITIDPEVLGTKTEVADHAAFLAPAQALGFDAEAGRAAVADLDGAAFAGPLVSAGDRSPVRRMLPFDPAGVVLFQALQTAVTLAQEGDAVGAEAVYAQATAFAAGSGRADDPLVAVARRWIDDAVSAR